MPTLKEVSVSSKKRDALEMSEHEPATPGLSGTQSGSEDTSSMPPPSPSSVTSAGSSKSVPQRKSKIGSRSVVSLVWEYFAYSEVNGTTKCLAENCSHTASGKNTGNLVSHLKTKHPERHKEYGEKEKARREVVDKKAQTTLAPVPTDAKPYRPGDPRYHAILRAISLLIAVSTVPFSFVEQRRFRALTKLLDPRCPVFGRKTLAAEIESLWESLRERMLRILENAGLISISTDVWTKKGMTESFLGVTAHFVDSKTKETHHFVLACRSFPSPHTAENVYRLVKEILSEWNITPDRISAVLTDNGSNMVCAFKNFVAKKLALIDEEEMPPSESDEMCMLRTSDPLDGLAFDAEAEQFISYENEENRLYADYNRLSCFIHTLQLVVRVFEKSEDVKLVMKKVRGLVSAFNRSSKATSALIRSAHKKLVADVSTRWNSVLLMVRSLVELKEHVRRVIVDENLKTPDLLPSEWKILEGIELLLGKFEVVTEKLSAEKVSTIHMIVPYLRELTFHLNRYTALDAYLELDSFGIESMFVEVVAKMQDELRNRFDFILNDENAKFVPLYTAANFLHELFRQHLKPAEVAIAREEITRMFLLRIKACNSVPGTSNNQPLIVRADDAGYPPAKKQKGCELDYLAALPQQPLRAPINSSPTTEQLKKELDLYCNGTVSDGTEIDQDPRQFWKNNSGAFPLLSLVALDILSIGSGTADVERLFSVAGLVSSGRRNRLSGSHLEMEVFIQKNEGYLD